MNSNKTVGYLIESRREEVGVPMKDLVAAMGGSRAIMYKWIENNRWTRERIEAAARLLVFKIIRFTESGVDIEIDGRDASFIVSGWIPSQMIRGGRTRKTANSHPSSALATGRSSRLLIVSATTDRPIAERFYATLRHYAGVQVWHAADQSVDNRIATSPLDCDKILLLWSRSLLEMINRTNKAEGVWKSDINLRAVIDACLLKPSNVILARLDDTPCPATMRQLQLSSVINTLGLLDTHRVDHAHVVWRSVVEIAGLLRCVSPLQPCLDLVKDKTGNPISQNGLEFFSQSIIGGGLNGSFVKGYMESFPELISDGVAYRVPAVPYPDGSHGFRFCAMNHVKGGYWWAVLSFAIGGDWRAVDMRPYKEMRFNARADYAGAPLGAAFADSSVNNVSQGWHNETSCSIFEIGVHWKPGSPYVIPLDKLRWGVTGSHQNMMAVNRQEVIQITVGNCGKKWEPGARWIEMKDITIV